MSLLHTPTNDSIVELRRALRDLLHASGIEVSTGHVTEAVATALGEGSHAALLAQLQGADGKLPTRKFDPWHFAERLSALSGCERGKIIGAFNGGLATLNGLTPVQPAEPAETPWRQVRRWATGGAETPLPPIDWNFSGRMIAPSKSGYYHSHPNNLIAFNANVVSASSLTVIWAGDLDVTRDADQLRAHSARLGEELLILRESANLHGDSAEIHAQAIAVVSPWEVGYGGSVPAGPRM